MPVPTPIYGQIACVIQRPRKRSDPLFHFLLVDVSHAQALGAALQLVGVLGSDNDAVRHHPDLDWHPVEKSCLRYPLAAQKDHVMRARLKYSHRVVGYGDSVACCSDLQSHLAMITTPD